MTDNEIIHHLITTVARLEERDQMMNRRIDVFQDEMNQITRGLQEAVKSFNAIRNVLVIFLVALIASGSIPEIKITPILRAFGLSL